MKLLIVHHACYQINASGCYIQKVTLHREPTNERKGELLPSLVICLACLGAMLILKNGVPDTEKAAADAKQAAQ